MSALEKLLKDFGEKSREDIIEKFSSEGLINKIKNKEDFLFYWKSRVGPSYYSDSILPVSRQAEIFKQLMDESLSKYIENKSRLLKEIPKLKINSLGEPAWSSINFSDSPMGKRLQFGFKNRGCQYWYSAKSKVGCYNCGYFMGTHFHCFFDMPDTDYHKIIIKQLDAVKKEYEKLTDFDGINIVGDGSFLNFWEIPKMTQIDCFKRFAKWENVTQLLVESRPEYVDVSWIEELLVLLRPDQVLEIAIGLESTDAFIRRHCINKGFGDIGDMSTKSSFKNIMNNIKKFSGKVRIQTYLLVKPAFLSESEALADAVNSGRVLYKWAEEINPGKPNEILSIKFEPIVVSRGTLLEVLYQKRVNYKRMYEPLNYWTVAELLVQSEYYGIDKIIRFGAREDMDDYIAMPVIPAKFGSISSIDFRIYHAVQKFTAKHSIIEFLSEIEALIHDQSFAEWKKYLEQSTTMLETRIKTYAKEISNFKPGFLNNLFTSHEAIPNLVQFLQYDKMSMQFFKNIAPRIAQNYSKSCRRVEEFIRKNGLDIPKKWKIEIKDISYVADSRFRSVIFKLDIENNRKAEIDVWVSVPTKIDQSISKEKK